MSPGGFVHERIVGLNTPAGTRVFTLKLPQQLSTWPAVRVQEILGPRPQHLRGPNYPIRTRVDVDGYCPELSGVDPVATVQALMEAIRGDGLGPSASGVFGWFGEAGGSPPTIKVLNVELNAGGPEYEPGIGTGTMSGVDLRLVVIRDEYVIHWQPL